MIHERYIAGFFDADGSVSLSFYRTSKDHPNRYKLTLRVDFIQHKDRIRVLEGIKNHFGFGNIYSKKDGCYQYHTSGKNALRVAERLHKHCVIKGEYLRNIINIYRNRNEYYSKEEKDILQKQVKVLRKQRNPRIYNYPSIKWMSGYIDGDGSLYSSWNKNKSTLQLCINISSSIWDIEGVELIQKKYKGNIRTINNSVMWYKNLDKGSIKLLQKLARNLILKKRNAEFLIELLSKGKHFKNNSTPQQRLKYHKYLKSLNALATTK